MNDETENEDDFPPLSDEDVAELKRRVADLEDPKRYMILSTLMFFELWHNINEDTWCQDQSSGTLYKREAHAKAVLSTMDKGTDVGIVPVLVDKDGNVTETGVVM